MAGSCKRRAPNGGAASAALLVFAVSPLLAQGDTPVPATDGATTSSEVAAAAATDEAPTIVVTGSRIKRRADFTFSNPVVTIGSEAIENSGTSNLTEFLKELPALSGSLTGSAAAGQAFIGGVGLELLNLRNLGIDRTLVLVDGRRHVAALPGTSAVDIETIPIALIEDVQVLTGGASAIYGADGVSGVVNFIMKRDFEGLKANLQVGESEEGDGRRWLGSVVGGHNFAGGRANITGAFEYARVGRLKSSARSFAGGGDRPIFVNNPAELENDPDDEVDDPNIPDQVPLRDIRYYDSSPAGQVRVIDRTPDDPDDDGLRGLFNGDGAPFDTGDIPFIPPFLQQGGDGTSLDTYIGDLITREERYTVNTFLTYQVLDNVRAFADLKYSRSESLAANYPTFDFGLRIQNDNPFIPDSIAAARTGDDNEIYISRDHNDLGLRDDDIRRETYRSVLGIDGEVLDDMHYEMSLVYGQTDVRDRIGNNRLSDRFAAALDVVEGPDGPTCRSNLDPDAAPIDNLVGGYEPLPGTWAGSFQPGPGSGCVPLNIFGDGAPSQAAIDWIMANSLATSRLRQTVFNATLSGKTFNWFVPSASEMGWAAGIERRIEKSEGHPALEDQRGLTFGNVLQPDEGQYQVSEVFAEIDVPVLEDRMLAKRFSVDAAIRLSDYNTVGNTRTWKIGAIWAPVNDISFRSTRAKATRAPNISELFDPGGQTFELITDPCDINELENGPAIRAANCASLLSALGVDDPATFTDDNSAAVAGVLRGNPELEEEDADTTTIGFVLQPRFIPGLTLSIDWYDVELVNAINTALPQEAVELCVDSPTTDNNFCSLIARQAGSGQIIGFLQQPVNVASFVTKGYDLNLRYLLDPGQLGFTGDVGEFQFDLIGNKLQELTFINLPGAAPDQDEREKGVPEWQFTFDLTWRRRALTMNYGLNYYGQTRRYTLAERRANPDIVDSRYFNYDDRILQDFHVRYVFVEKIAVWAGVNNLADKKPDFGEYDYPTSALGRFFYAGMEVSLF